ncbi:MAG TPA: histidine kinase [Acidimicrobiales bacterium]|nr:histidine kinase [Acidimicrobiales bacterium]
MIEQGPAWSQTDALRRYVPVAAGLTVVGALLSAPGEAPENVVAALAVVPFVVWAFVWRSMPTLLLVALVSGAEFAALSSGELEPLLFLMCVVSAVVGTWESSSRLMVAGAGLALATPVLIEALFPDDVLYGVWIMGILLSLLLPRSFRWQLTLVTELAVAREELVRQAALDEKRAIARDVHDLVGHGLAAVLLNVTGARHVLRRDPDAADEALADAETIGRRSLQELRRTIGVLRETDGAASEAPVPGADGLADVVASAQAAGLDAALRTLGDLGRVDPIVGLSLHRVVEEALANARQHAPRAVTDVLVAVEGDAVVMTVDSVGPLREPEPADADRPRYGVVGMRERMAAVGGSLDVGPTATGWRVRCRVPLAADLEDVT